MHFSFLSIVRLWSLFWKISEIFPSLVRTYYEPSAISRTKFRTSGSGGDGDARFGCYGILFILVSVSGTRQAKLAFSKFYMCPKLTIAQLNRRFKMRGHKAKLAQAYSLTMQRAVALLTAMLLSVVYSAPDVFVSKSLTY